MQAVDEYIETELERVERWRTDAFVRAGFSADQAASLAGRSDIDLHAAIGLVEQGCPPDVAVRILL